MGWMSEVEESRNDKHMKGWWCPSEDWKIRPQKRSINCIEEGKILTSQINPNFNFDLENGSRMSKSKKIGQNVIKGYQRVYRYDNKIAPFDDKKRRMTWYERQKKMKDMIWKKRKDECNWLTSPQKMKGELSPYARCNTKLKMIVKYKLS